MTDEMATAGEAGAEERWLAWDNRIRVLLNPSAWGGVLAALGIILVKGGFLQKPIGLYCTPESYDQAEATLRQECSGATIV